MLLRLGHKETMTDVLNETVTEAQGPVGTVGYVQNYPAAIPVATTAPTAYPDYPPPQRFNDLGGADVYRGQMCSPTNHYYECKHEVTCFCGRTQRRTELQMDEGL